MDKWLTDFEYRIDIGWQIFALAAYVAALITLLTVGYQAIRAALMNPVKSLKSEYIIRDLLNPCQEHWNKKHQHGLIQHLFDILTKAHEHSHK